MKAIVFAAALALVSSAAHAAERPSAGMVWIRGGEFTMGSASELARADEQPTHRVRAYRRAAETIAALPVAEVRARTRAGTLTELPGIGPKTEAVIVEAMEGTPPSYLVKLEKDAKALTSGGTDLRAELRGDLHLHSDWSDGGSTIEEMARTAHGLGHEYVVLTDHSAIDWNRVVARAQHVYDTRNATRGVREGREKIRKL